MTEGYATPPTANNAPPLKGNASMSRKRKAYSLARATALLLILPGCESAPPRPEARKDSLEAAELDRELDKVQAEMEAQPRPAIVIPFVPLLTISRNELGIPNE